MPERGRLTKREKNTTQALFTRALIMALFRRLYKRHGTQGNFTSVSPLSLSVGNTIFKFGFESAYTGKSCMCKTQISKTLHCFNTSSWILLLYPRVQEIHSPVLKELQSRKKD